MLVRVKYWKGGVLNGYAGFPYTYRTNLPLNVGDVVVAPTAKEPMQRAIVVETNVPESVVDPAWEHTIKTITNRWEDMA